MGTELWAIWGDIALQELELARAGRAKVAAAIAGGDPYDLNDELYPAMLTIVASASSIDGFAAVVSAAGVQGKAPRVKSPGRAHYIWETLRAGFSIGAKTNSWPKQLKDLFLLRSDRTSGGLVHPRTVFGVPAQHPLVSGVAPARALYTLEAAEQAVALMRDIYATCKSNVRPGLAALATRIGGLQGPLDRLS